jgi:hypothetical protein
MMPTECTGVAVDVNNSLRPPGALSIYGNYQTVVLDGVIKSERGTLIHSIRICRDESTAHMLPGIRTRRNEGQLSY